MQKAIAQQNQNRLHSHVLLLTLFPVKAGLDLASIALGLSGAMPISRLLISKIDAVGLWTLYSYRYLNSRDLAKGGAHEQ